MLAELVLSCRAQPGLQLQFAGHSPAYKRAMRLAIACVGSGMILAAADS